MTNRTSFTFVLNAEQKALLRALLAASHFRPVPVPHTTVAVEAPDCRINLYKSGKLLVQGRGAEEFVTFRLEPEVLLCATVGYEDVLNPEATAPHCGVDESGKGDFFGPLVIAGAYVDPELAEAMRALDVKDSKRITSDDKAIHIGRELRRLLGRRCTVVKVGPAAYNRLYARMRNVNTLLAWGHARAIENILEHVPGCPRAVSDQFGSKQQVERALMKKGQKIELVQMPRAESDLAVAAASIIAREVFLTSLRDMAQHYGQPFPKGASPAVREAASQLVAARGAPVLAETAKCHFKTADDVLGARNLSRADLPPEARAVSRPKQPRAPRP